MPLKESPESTRSALIFSRDGLERKPNSGTCSTHWARQDRITLHTNTKGEWGLRQKDRPSVPFIAKHKSNVSSHNASEADNSF